MLVDYHLHLRPDGEPLDERALTREHLIEYVAIAIARGIEEIAFTEHVYRFTAAGDLLDHPFWHESATGDLDAYIEALRRAGATGLPILAGLELDWIEGRARELAAIAESRPWDVVLGSVHWLGGLAVDHPDYSVWDELGVDEVWRAYADALCEAATSGIFDVMAHPDLAKVFGHRPSAALRTALNRQIVEAFAVGGVAFEVSTAGLHKAGAEIYPAADLLAQLRHALVPVTLGSDAHVADDVGRDYPRALTALANAGYRTIVRFRGRERMVADLGAFA